MTRRRVIVCGLVQGVGFRFSVARIAESLGVTGWVRNQVDGSVEVVVEGAPDAVESIVDWCRHGPRGSRVDDVTIHEETPEGLPGFRMR